MAAVRGAETLDAAEMSGRNSLFRFFVLAPGFLLLSELGPGLRHFDQQGLVGLVRGLVGQTEAFGRAPLMVLESSHEPSRAATRTIAIRFLELANVDKS
jgi:hypothetical protein